MRTHYDLLLTGWVDQEGLSRGAEIKFDVAVGVVGGGERGLVLLLTHLGQLGVGCGEMGWAGGGAEGGG